MITAKHAALGVSLLVAPALAIGQEAASQAAAEEVATVPVAEESAPAADAAEPERAKSRIVQEIIVTAQKREENLKEVPLSVTALPAEALDARQVLSVQDMPKVAPGLTVTPQASFVSLFLRGVGSDAYALGDPLVVYYVDGVYIPFAQALFTDLGVIEQVEILKGPQGTLFGRNALGGAIKTTTKDPSLTGATGQFQQTFANYDTTKTSGYVSIPLMDDQLAIGVAGFYKTQEPFVDSYNKPERVPLQDPTERGFQVRIKYVPTDWLTVRLTHSVNDDRDSRGYNVVTDPGPILLATGYTGQDPRNAYLDHNIESESINRISFADLTFHAPWIDVKLLGSYQNFYTETAVDFDGSDRPIAHFINDPGISKVKTAELQLLSNDTLPGSDWVETVFGVYYFDSHAGFRGGLNAAGFFCPDGSLSFLNCGDPVLSVPGVGTALNAILGPLGINVVGSPLNLGFISLLDTKSIAFYNQTKFTITDWMSLTVGARYQDEKRELANSSGLFRASGDVYDTSMDVAYQHYTADEFHDTTRKLDPKVSISFQPPSGFLGDNPLIYASYQTATTSSTFNAINIIPLDRPEFVRAVRIKAYEVGYKTRLFDDVLDLNAAAFWYDIEDPQVQFISLLAGGAVTFENAEKQRVKGVEFDFTARVLPTLLDDSLILFGNATWLDAKYTSYKDGTGFTDQYVYQVGQDYSGSRVTRTPKVAYSVGLLETLETGRGPLEIGADYSYRSSVYYLAQNSANSKEPGYGLLGVHVSYLYDPWNLRVTAFGDNVLDKEYNYAIFILDFGKNEIPAPGRIYGLKVNWSF